MDVVTNPLNNNPSGGGQENNTVIGTPPTVINPSIENPANPILETPPEENKNNDWLSKWGYAAIGGGVAAVGVASAITYRVVSKTRMVNKAKADAKELYMRQEGDMTPRNDFTPRDGNKKAPNENLKEETGLL